jgi:bifunctional non-homologous end joining protein LigD
MSLTEYNRKRSFTKTPEPPGSRKKPTAKYLRFVVQEHHASHLHYDFRLELDGVLKSWAIPKGPSMDPSVKRLAMEVEDHPVSYIAFEGTIPKGNYGAGRVYIWDSGLYHSSETMDPKENVQRLKAGYHKGTMKFLMMGEKLKGMFALVKIRDKSKQKNAWLLIKEKDEYARTDAGWAKTSVEEASETGKNELVTKVLDKRHQLKKPKKGSVPLASRAPIPRNISPMLATLTDKPFDRPGWIFETKWDGYRAIAEIENGKVNLYSRRGNSLAADYPPIMKSLESVTCDAVFDGEIVALKKGLPDFHTLQNYGEEKAEIKYVIFDLLYINGEDLRELPLIERKKRLAEVFPKNPAIILSEYVEEKGEEFFKKIVAQDIEGVLAKDASSSYLEGKRTEAWLKIKHWNEQEAVIAGFTEPRGSRKKIGALVLGAYEGETLKYIGHSGGGFTQKELSEIHALLAKIITEKSPINEKVSINSPITWVKPKYVCQIKFSEWTVDGRMRHPIYAGLRKDKKANEVVIEKPKATEQPKLTNLDKVYFPKDGYTKGDVINYYDQISNVILPYLKDRPQSLFRQPNGIKAKGFFQKDVEMEVPDFVETHKIWSESNKKEIRYLICQNKETLLYLANLGCIEVNPWNSRIRDLEKPDYMIIDLDPGDNTLDELIKVARVTRDVLMEACEEHYIKTSGKTGLHIFIPLGARYDHDTVRTFSELLVNIIHKRIPELTSLERGPSKRKHKIYLDWLQNRRGQTLAAPYSVRPADGATVSTPLKWEEVKKGLDPKKFTIKTIFKRLKKYGDLWKPVLTSKVNLETSIKCLERMKK